MKKTPFIINIDENGRDVLPNYYDYAIVLDKIKQLILKETNFTMKIYIDNENQEELWNVLEEDVASGHAKLLSYIYDYAETGAISYKQSGEQQGFVVKPSINNSIYFYSDYRVAFVRLPIYQSYTDYERQFIFAENDECLLAFIKYAYERQREMMKNSVSVFTDTEDGVERSHEEITQQVAREDVLLEEELKSEIYRSIDEFFNESGQFFKTYEIPYKRGILLYGHPGNGKTTLVKSIAGSVSAPIAYWQITEYTSSYSIKEVFSIVAKMAPMVLVIEDIDSMPESSRSVFLNTLDGATSKEGIFLIGTTNYPERIDPALINRAGRFDRAYEIKNPNRELRLKYLYFKKMDRFIEETDLKYIADRTERFSVAQLNELYTASALQWHYERTVDIESVIENLEVANEKTRKQEWDMDDHYSKVGFDF